MCDILNKWTKEFNLYFSEKHILIRGMIEWCSSITSSISSDDQNSSEI
jgi:hypothetical protein